MLEALKNSRYLQTWGAVLLNQGWYGAVLVIAKITQMIIWPKVSLQLGEVDPVDLEFFPKHLKHLLKIKAGIIISASLWMVFVFVVMQLTK